MKRLQYCSATETGKNGKEEEEEGAFVESS
jgi:hypothetical protein